MDGAPPELSSAPTEEIVSVHIDAAPGEQAGLACFFNDRMKTRDLSMVNELAINGEITDGATLSITLGIEGGLNNIPFRGCTYTLTGEGRGEYELDLLTPNTCEPEPCFELHVSQINFFNALSDEATSIDLSIESIELREDPDRPLPPSGQVGTAECD
jgi:hypothetical protein